MVLVRRDEAIRIAKRLGGDKATPADFVPELWTKVAAHYYEIDVPEGSACPLLTKDGRCSVHDIKPRQCRTYPFWPELLESKEAWDSEELYCEGINRPGRNYDLDEIWEVLLERRATKENYEDE